MHILFVTATRIGDAVLSTGLLNYLSERYPDARLTIAAGPVAAPLFEAVPRLERVVIIEKRRWALHWVPLYAAVAVRRWDLVVDLRGSALAWLLRARDRKVMAKGDAREHRVRQLGHLFDLDPPPSPRLWTAPHHEHAAKVLVPPNGPVLAIGPAANWRGKQWRAERFAELAHRLTAANGLFPGTRIAVIAAGHERAQAEPLLKAIPTARLIDLVGNLDLLTASAVLRRSALFIGNDTGLMHIAAAVGAPTLGLFGPSPIEQYAAWGERTAVVRTADPPESMFREGFDHRTTDTLMDSLSVEAVEAAAHALWCRLEIAAA
ncbi:MAG: glycosyltransferase family 9 protein [Alphaproteobacteria bacterium]|nr:glycosyltransferase family 9 protein [Alphaproteobacteria bacterium]MBV9377855.1 glycosyltransferase family 9 protein [Alphaproteobacteria bacterium]